MWGNLGNGDTESRAYPTRVQGDLSFLSIEAGAGSLACGVTVTDDAYCWGLNWRGEVGGVTDETCRSDPWTLSCATRPVRVPRVDGIGFHAVSPGASFACGVLLDGRGVCWGVNNQQQLGTETDGRCEALGTGFPDAPCSRVPLEVDGGYRFASLSASAFHSCAVTVDGEAVCWGANNVGQLGDGTVWQGAKGPSLVVGDLQFTAVAAGSDHSCGVTRDQAIYCWGMNVFGQLGVPDAGISEFPLRVPLGP